MIKRNWIRIDSDARKTWSWKLKPPSPQSPREFRRQRQRRHGKRILSPLMGFSSRLQHPWVPGTVAKASQRIPLAPGEGGQFINAGSAWHLTHHTSAAPLSFSPLLSSNQGPKSLPAHYGPDSAHRQHYNPPGSLMSLSLTPFHALSQLLGLVAHRAQPVLMALSLGYLLLPPKGNTP